MDAVRENQTSFIPVLSDEGFPAVELFGTTSPIVECRTSPAFAQRSLRSNYLVDDLALVFR